jgi:hypothetical protein
MIKSLLIGAAILGLASPAFAGTNGCSPGAAYTYDAKMSPASVAVHQSVQATATCAKPTDPTEYIRLSLIRAKQNPGGGGGDGGNK